METAVVVICSGSHTGSMGMPGSPLMMMAFRLSRVSALARMQQNMDLPLPGLPQTVIVLDMETIPPFCLRSGLVVRIIF